MPVEDPHDLVATSTLESIILARWDGNPLDRTEYLLRVERRVPLAEPGRE